MKIEELKNRLFNRVGTVKCYCCGKEIQVPNMLDKDKGELKPYCLSTILLLEQWLIHEGWHIRDLGRTDNHPYFCPDCWKKGTPEVHRADYCDEWYEQAKAWMNEKL